MMRLATFFIAACMTLIAASFGAALYFVFGLSGPESTLVAVTALASLALYNAVAGRKRDRSDVAEQISDLSRGTADIARQVAELSRRLAAAEVKVGTAVDMAVAAAKPVAAEIEELGALIKQLAETVAAHDIILDGGEGPLAASLPAAPSSFAAKSAPVAAAEPAPGRNRIDLSDLEPEPQPAPASTKVASGRFKGMERSEVAAMIRGAVDANRLDLHLQPIVTLPQRKVRFYEAMARLRTAEGEVIVPADFLPFAEEVGLMPQIDNLMLFRCVQVVRRLLSKNREIGMFCNVSASTLVDPEFFPQFSEFMEANRALAPSLVLEFTQSAYRSFGPMENESLAALASRGFRFSMDNVGDLRFEPRDLGERGFKFLKVPASLLLDRTGATVSDIHPADLSGLLTRFGIELVSERIESEGVVVDLLDYDVKYGQGFLFSPPRPVRAEIMQAIPDREVTTRDALPAEAPTLQAPLPSQPEPVISARAAAGGEARPAGQRKPLGQLARGLVARG
jgi:cyclic-di-GMP phosphodiesterase, flagellum assembly factor TipF